ncbi:MAG: hypothetical protein DYG98_18370 [Haliscomenobacteraceae bacterium CHB4]|nr:hypothetical protein [Haliscomenobacteraceae bacterium CHB4]
MLNAIIISKKQGLAIIFFLLMSSLLIFVFVYKYQRQLKTNRNRGSMVLISSGVYEIGCPHDTLLYDLRYLKDLNLNIASSLLKSPEEVVIENGFYIDAFEVTNKEYSWFNAFMNWFDKDAQGIFAHKDAPSGKNYEPKYSHDAKFNGDDQPVVGVDWYDAFAYSKFIGMQLPTNKQWEYVCKNGGKTIFPWGNKYDNNKTNIDNDNFFVPVEGKNENFIQGRTNNYIYHMAGNVAEWTESWKTGKYMRMASARGGGCYHKPGSIHSLCFVNEVVEATYKGKDIGIRLVSSENAIQPLSFQDFLVYYKDSDLSSYDIRNRYYNYEWCISKIDSIRTNKRMRYVKSGKYLSGPPANNKLLEIVRLGNSPTLLERFFSQPSQKLNAHNFFIDSTEVTNAEYALFLKDPLVRIHWYGHPLEPAGKNYTPKFWQQEGYNDPLQPVVGVDWWDAYAYAKWAGKRLPTKEEWEIAARMGKVNYYPWGDNYIDSLCATLEKEKKYPIPVTENSGDFAPSNVQNLAGNVSEWTSSEETEGVPSVNAYIKGGNYMRLGKIYSILFLDEKAPKNMRHQSVGFRCAMNAH